MAFTQNDLLSEIERGGWQKSFDSLPDKIWDVVIIGAGPAGATTAIDLASRGCDVLLLDKTRFPRDKACGDGLIPDAHRCLQKAGVWEEVLFLGHIVNTARVFSPSRIQFEVPGRFVTLKRHVLDALLCRAAEKEGAVVSQGNVINITFQGGEVAVCAVAESGKACCARVVVVATGADVRLIKGLRLVERSKASAVAIRCYVRSSLELNTMVSSYDKSIIPGYAWIFPMGEQEYNIGCGIFYSRRTRRHINLRSFSGVRLPSSGLVSSHRTTRR